MTDPRNVAHDKTVALDKEHAGEDPAEGAAVTPQPGKKPPSEKTEDDENEAAE